ncbi:hypothetical protein WH7805_01707 [Synechococcus sp. WH 7805]|nr:hypothetical protein WH7805_01707 [Synechococcus sp. WH 7805]
MSWLQNQGDARVEIGRQHTAMTTANVNPAWNAVSKLTAAIRVD